ncbi:hypothetical protein HANVADRAFT_74834 [Hanseniaspora valbyensis NRRL Y-1626]|uniref:Uncharacterized protein n=1 Tax=Hanseniaspora valbyensis NRRL Y-1626 TaxID=766949 RepID=A0A1B7TDR4_9ASCO|nr:hypothetical protein HANVADRAFT_74834 [Hanseniaspora valbyensis NRRL Y-1626]
MTDSMFDYNNKHFEHDPNIMITGSPTKFSAFNNCNNKIDNLQHYHSIFKNISEEKNTKKHVSDHEFSYFDELAYLQSNRYNNFNRDVNSEMKTVTDNNLIDMEKDDEIIDFSQLRNNNRNLPNSKKRISEESTLVAFQKKVSLPSKRKISNSSASYSDKTVFTSTSKVNNNQLGSQNDTKLSFLKSISLFKKNNSSVDVFPKKADTQLIERLEKINDLFDDLNMVQKGYNSIDDLQYLILSSKFFQTSSSDPQGGARVFSIPLKQSMVNLSTVKSNDFQDDKLEETIKSAEQFDITKSLNILDIILEIKKIKRTKTFKQLPKYLYILTIFMTQSINKFKKKQCDFENYLSNFINNLESFNFHLQKLESQCNATTESLIRSSITPVLLKILMSLENLLAEGLPTSEHFWSYYLPMFFQDINFLENITNINYSTNINEFIFQFRKIIQLYLLFLIPSQNLSYNIENWKIIFPDLKVKDCLSWNKTLSIDKFVESFDKINNCLKSGKELLGDIHLIDWSKKQTSFFVQENNIAEEGNISSPTTQTFEYSELMQKIGFNENNINGMHVDDIDRKSADYANLQSTLQNILLSLSINSSIMHIDTEINEFLNCWTNYKLSSSNTLNTIEAASITTMDGVSTPIDSRPLPSRPETLRNHKLLNTLKTLSDVELNDKLQLKLKELHMENLGAQKKKKSELSLTNFNTPIDLDGNQFKNLREDDIALYYQIDQLQSLQEESDENSYQEF